MSFYAPGKLTDATSEIHPEVLQDIKKIKDEKRSSRILTRASELVWMKSRQNSRTARLIDPRLGFKNSLVNLAISEISAGAHTGKHKHTEAYVYILKGKGHSIINEKRYDWSEGDAIYVPPDTFHQHFNDGKEPAVYLRVLPGPLMLNLLALMATLNVSLDNTLEAKEAASDYGQPLKSYFG